MTVQFEGRRKRGQSIRVWERLDEVGGLWVSPYIPEWCHFGSRQGVAPTEPPAVWMTKCWSGCSEGPQRGLRKSTGDTVNTSHSIPPANHYKRHCAPCKKCAHAALGLVPNPFPMFPLVLNLCDFLTYEEYKRRYFEECLSVFVNESQWAPKLFGNQLFF